MSIAAVEGVEMRGRMEVRYGEVATPDVPRFYARDGKAGQRHPKRQ